MLPTMYLVRVVLSVANCVLPDCHIEPRIGKDTVRGVIASHTISRVWIFGAPTGIATTGFPFRHLEYSLCVVTFTVCITHSGELWYESA